MIKRCVCARLLMAVVAILSIAQIVRAAELIYDQPLALSSGLVSIVSGPIVADQFVLTTKQTITGVRWFGFFARPGVVIPRTGHVQGLKFKISFFDDKSGLPNKRMDEQTVSVLARNTGFHAELFRGEQPIYEFLASQIRPI